MSSSQLNLKSQIEKGIKNTNTYEENYDEYYKIGAVVSTICSSCSSFFSILIIIIVTVMSNQKKNKVHTFN